jgi:hypothetical protein
MAYGVADGIHQREDFQQQGLLARAPAEILGDGPDKFFAPRAYGLQQGAQSAEAALGIGRLLRKSRALCGQYGRQIRLRDVGAGSARKCGL